MKHRSKPDNQNKKEFDAALKEVNKKYGKALKRLSKFEKAVAKSFKKFPRMYKNLAN
jgi:hypothetical protein